MLVINTCKKSKLSPNPSIKWRVLDWSQIIPYKPYPKWVSVTADQDKVDCVIIYGNLLVEFLDTFSSKKISLAL